MEGLLPEFPTTSRWSRTISYLVTVYDSVFIKYNEEQDGTASYDTHKT
jgi:hypothetical protein